MTINDYLTLASVLISIAAFLYAYKTNTKKYELLNQYRTEVLLWFSDTTDIIIRLKLEARDQFPNNELKRELLSKLSSKIEKGRFYFPNIQNGHGEDKPLANQGFRNIALDFLVFSYRLFEKEEASSLLSHAEMLQKHFTSHIFEIINPKRFLKDTETHTQWILSSELTFEKYMEHKPEVLETFIKKYRTNN